MKPISCSASVRDIDMGKVERIGLLAGGGELPVIFADEARKKGAKVVAFAARDITSRELDAHVDKIYWIDLRETKKLPLLFLTNRIKNLVMIGKIEKSVLFNKDLSESGEIGSLLKDTENRADDSLMRKVSQIAGRFGVKFLDPADFLSDFMPEKGTLTERSPTPQEWDDIEFGRDMARSLGKLDIGQTVVIRDKAVLAVEAIEGTDEAIKRGGRYSGAGAVVVKMIKPGQDTRFDIPTVGKKTIDSMVESNANVLAIEAEKTFFINKEESIKKANEHNIAIVAI